MAKNYIITMTLLILVNFIVLQFPRVTKTPFEDLSNYYSDVYVITEIDHENGVATLESLNENKVGWSIHVDAASEFVCGAVYSIIMDRNGTPTASDDIVVKMSWIASSPVVEYIAEGW